ncbi:hypothetical protein JB92DRAFT_2831049 [Gautieria morchelliformis]|nr:hypothetical protein JB92DRAFT_2831049 [Gautieria morchelliformis]
MSIVLEQWFPKKKKADGIIYGASFNPIPESTIALVFTVVYYAVHQWTSGIHIKGSNFTEVGYAKALAHHQQRMHDHRCAHAGFPNNPTNPRKPAFNAAKFAHAAQALDEDEELDSRIGIPMDPTPPWGSTMERYMDTLLPRSVCPLETTEPYGPLVACYCALRRATSMGGHLQRVT